MSQKLASLFDRGLVSGGFNPRKKKNCVQVEVRGKDGKLKQVFKTYNLRTNDGIDFVAAALGNSGSQPAAADYIAVTEDVTAPAATDTTLASELTVDGLSRAQGTFAHTTAATSYTIQHTFTVTGGPHTVAKAGLFNAPAGGTMVFEALFGTTAVVTTSDTLTVTWTINI